MKGSDIMKKSMLLLFLVSVVFVMGCSEAGVLLSTEKSSSFVPYKFYELNNNWDDAKSYCESLGEGWHIATINSAEEQEYVYWDIIGYPSNRDKPIWIGLRDYNNDTLYSDDEWVYGDSSYRQWHTGYGDGGQPGWCASIDNGLGEQGNWHDSLCDYTIVNVVCEFKGGGFYHFNFQPSSSSVPVGYKMDDGSVYTELSGHGWDIDRTIDTRERNGNPDQRLDTLIHSGSEPHAYWALDLIPGLYEVNIGVGDHSFAHPLQNIVIEGKTFLRNESTSSGEFISKNETIVIKDGQLNLEMWGHFVDTLNSGVVLNYIDVIFLEKICSDGTKIGDCSVNKPNYCDAGELVQDCSTCGCPSSARCVASTGKCSFRTPYTPKVELEGFR